MAKFIGFILLFVIVVGFAIPSLFLDSAYAMDRTTTMKAPAQKIHGVIADFRTWGDWTVWNKDLDPTLERTYEKDPGEVGHTMTWKGDDLGEGTMTLTEITPEAIRYTMTYEGMPSTGEFLIEAREGGETGVLWSNAGEFEGMPFKRYYGLFADKVQGPMFEEGLANLKTRVEAQ